VSCYTLLILLDVHASRLPHKLWSRRSCYFSLHSEGRGRNVHAVPRMASLLAPRGASGAAVMCACRVRMPSAASPYASPSSGVHMVMGR